MGKIFEALEKSKKENKRSAPTNRGSELVVDRQTGKRANGPTGQLTNKKQVVSVSTETREPLYKDNLDKNLVTLLNPQSFESEQFKILRTNLLFPVSGKPPRCIMITSAVPGEGKSFVSANLAVSIAQNIDEHVLLVDCDIRKPTIHSVFGFDDVQGLSEYLSKGIALSSLLIKTDLNKLTLLPAGNPPPNPAELLSSQQMSELIKEVKERYNDRYIIIDSPPPQLTAETSAIARQVDGVILVVKYGCTPRHIVAELIDILGKEKILGVVVNWYDIRSSISNRYGKYGKYYKKYSYYHK